MSTFIDFNTIDVLCRNYRTDSVNKKENTYTAYEEEHKEEKHKEEKSQQSVWTKITSKVKAVWRKIKPAISELTTFFTVTALFLKSVTKFVTQCKNMKAAFA